MASKANRTIEAIKLRTAALKWALYTLNPNDQHDRKGVSLNTALLRAAIAYAKVAENV